MRLKDEGVLGDIELVLADFGARGSPDPHGRVYDPALGRRVLCSTSASIPSGSAISWLGKPKAIALQSATWTPTGVDARTRDRARL